MPVLYFLIDLMYEVRCDSIAVFGMTCLLLNWTEAATEAVYDQYNEYILRGTKETVQYCSTPRLLVSYETSV